MKKNSGILVLGHKGLVGSSIVRELEKQGYTNILTTEDVRYDLRLQSSAEIVMYDLEPQYVFLAAAKVGGINMNNTQSGEMIHNNLAIQTSVIEACHKFNVKKLLFLGSSCIYPKNCPQPIKEEYLLSGEMESTNIGYAIAKIAGVVMCDMYRKQYGCNFISVMPTNLYGPNDNFHLTGSHVLPAFIRKFHDAKVNNQEAVELWGTGSPLREFLHVDDCANGLIFLMNNYDESGPINIGTGEDLSIKELVELMKDIIGFKGEVIWNSKYPDGTPKKQLDVSKINYLGWHAKTSLRDGIKTTYEWFKDNYKDIRK